MKKILLAALIAASAPTLACAETAKPAAHPAMWIVKDKDTTIYLFGTFHLLDGKRAWFNDGVKTAFDASDEVMLEAIIPDDPTTLQPLILKYAIDPAGKTLSSKLSATENAKLDKELAGVGIPAKGFEMFEPWFVATTLTALGAQKLGLSGENGPEAIITKAAKASGKPVGQLESVEFQLGLLDKLPEQQQIKFLDQTADEMSKLGTLFPPMLNAWANGDTETLAKMTNQGLEPGSELYKTLFTRRNAAWAAWVEERLKKPGTVFVAVGAGHLAGQDSVQRMLAKGGIQSQRVKG
jgi:uncharacterized protein YbaP (TraB family)